jgi:hypothetical protein
MSIFAWLLGDEWKLHHLAPEQEETSIDGRALKGWVMRKKTKSGYEHDSLTDKEMVELHLDLALWPRHQ